jgi:putative transposase
LIDDITSIYQELCQRYSPKPKPEKKRQWGKKLLSGINLKPKKDRVSPGQQSLPWQNWQIPVDEIHHVAKQFILANCLNPDIAALQFTDTS